MKYKKYLKTYNWQNNLTLRKKIYDYHSINIELQSHVYYALTN